MIPLDRSMDMKDESEDDRVDIPFGVVDRPKGGGEDLVVDSPLNSIIKTSNTISFALRMRGTTFDAA